MRFKTSTWGSIGAVCALWLVACNSIFGLGDASEQSAQGGSLNTTTHLSSSSESQSESSSSTTTTSSVSESESSSGSSAGGGGSTTGSSTTSSDGGYGGAGGGSSSSTTTSSSSTDTPDLSWACGDSNFSDGIVVDGSYEFGMTYWYDSSGVGITSIADSPCDGLGAIRFDSTEVYLTAQQEVFNLTKDSCVTLRFFARSHDIAGHHVDVFMFGTTTEDYEVREILYASVPDQDWEQISSTCKLNYTEDPSVTTLSIDAGAGDLIDVDAVSLWIVPCDGTESECYNPYP